MALRQTLFSNIFWRNVFADFGTRSGNSKSPGAFTPYFQYRIGAYQQDYYLYFSKEPFVTRYKNEIFNKLHEYSGYDTVNYLEFHFDIYANKIDFLRFLHYEITERLKKKPSQPWRVRLEAVQEWAGEKKEQLRQQQEAVLKAEIEQEVQAIVKQPASNADQTNAQVQALVEKLNGHILQLMEEATTGMRDLSSSFTGNIQLNNRQHEDKLVQLLILLQQVQAPGRNVEQLFKRISAVDLASILHLHFEAFRNVKFNTVQKKISEQSEIIRATNPQVKKLTEALQEFFYK